MSGAARIAVIWQIQRPVQKGQFKPEIPDRTTELCPSSYKMEHQSGLSFGGSGSLV